MPAPTKDSRLNVRLRAADDELIRRAAEMTGQSVSEFLTKSAIDRAHEVLADQRAFVLLWRAIAGPVARHAGPPERGGA